MKPFAEALEDGPVLFDGAMGSLLYQRGVFLNRNYDELNLSQPALIRQVYSDYAMAGAQVIETNTFSANRVALAKHGFSDRVVEINQAGARLAREVVGDTAYVAGAVGPTGINFSVATEASRARAIAAMTEQMQALCDAGVDLLILETFFNILELEAAIAAAHAVSPEMPVVAQLVFGADGHAEGGLAPREVAERLRDAGALVVGANCGTGPAELYEVGAAMVGCGAPVAIQPNAGFPSIVDGRTIYVANPEHFGVFARRMLKSGVRVIGGCCGTTPAHTRSMLGAVRMMGGGRAIGSRTFGSRTRAHTGPVTGEHEPVAACEPGQGEAAASVVAVAVGESMPGREPVPLAERSRLGARLAAGEFAVSVELTSPQGTSPARLLGQIERLIAAGVDIINIADGPRASARMSNLAMCALARATTGIEPILHVCCRDRNFLGLVSHLFGAHALGLRDLVIITGDPPKMGDYPFATPVYDVDSIGLLQMASALNRGVDPSGKQTGAPTAFVLATGAEPAAADHDREIRRLEDKRAAGAELVMTQPVYDPRTLERFLDDVEPLGLPVMVGILPLASHRNAEFLHNEVPGMRIPKVYRDRMAAVGSGPAAQAEGVAIAREALAAVADRVAGVYVMPPFNRVESAIAVLEVVRGRWTPAPRPEPPGLVPEASPEPGTEAAPEAVKTARSDAQAARADD